jgi:hypothetical protein
MPLTQKDAQSWDDPRLAEDGHPISWNRLYRDGALVEAWPGRQDFWANLFAGSPHDIPSHHNIPIGDDARRHLPQERVGSENTFIGCGAKD